jgi:hypothetical protein
MFSETLILVYYKDVASESKMTDAFMLLLFLNFLIVGTCRF